MKSINRLTRHRRIIPWIIYLIMLAALAVWVSNRGGAISYVFFFTVLLYPVAALIHIFYTRAFLKIYQEVDGRLLYKMTSVDYQIFIECAGIFPMAGIKLTALDEVTLFGENFADQIYTLLPREKVKLNRTTLQQVFRQVYGLTVYEYRTQVRMQEARNLLLKESLTVTDVAGQCGYTNASKFAAAFRKVTGMNPGEWKRLNKA